VRACLRRNHPGPFQIQAAIAAVHADADHSEDTDWSQIVALYDQLLVHRPDAVVSLNREVAVAELQGPAAGLAALEEFDPAPVREYQPFHAVRADLLRRTGDAREAAAAYDRAIELTTNPTERRFLETQRAGIA
jgi:RNA polymerase sigma-70 factor (ECF subfamily)